MPAGPGRVLLSGRSLGATWLEDTERAVVPDLVYSRPRATQRLQLPGIYVDGLSHTAGHLPSLWPDIEGLQGQTGKQRPPHYPIYLPIKFSCKLFNKNNKQFRINDKSIITFLAY